MGVQIQPNRWLFFKNTGFDIGVNDERGESLRSLINTHTHTVHAQTCEALHQERCLLNDTGIKGQNLACSMLRSLFPQNRDTGDTSAGAFVLHLHK